MRNWGSAAWYRAQQTDGGIRDMVQEGKIRIRRANIYDWDEAMALAWRTFLRFEANDYGQEGIDNFRDFLTDALLHRMFLKGDYPVFIALDGEKQAGMISLRNKRHISLLFVEEGHHHQGIGRRLIQSMEQYIQTEYQERKITVNAAPYAVGFYRQVGFEDVAPQLSKDGIIYTPMEKKLL